MAMNKGPTLMDGDLPEQENVLHRVLQLPVVSGTCECFQKTYNSTKEAHPLVASVCNAYEKGVQSASNLAAWSMEPVVRRLSTQCLLAFWANNDSRRAFRGKDGQIYMSSDGSGASSRTSSYRDSKYSRRSSIMDLQNLSESGEGACILSRRRTACPWKRPHPPRLVPLLKVTAANELACRGLDHLEEKIPALQYPPEKIASELKGTISTRLRSARNSISVPIASTSDKVLASCELALGMAKETAEYAANTRVGRLASGGADLALGSIEKVVDFLLPPAKEESATVSGRQRAQKAPKTKPSLVRRVSTLANTLSRHTMQTTAWALKQGHSLAMWIPGVAPLSSLAQWGASAAMQVVSRRQSEVRVPWLHNLAASQDESHDDQTDTEGEETDDDEEEEGSEAEESMLREVSALPNPRGLLGGVVYTMQKTLQSTISAVTWAPAAVLGTVGRILHLTPAQAVSSTKGRAMSLSDALKGVTDNVVDTVVHYVPLPRLSLMEPESEFRDIDNPPAEAERKGSVARPASPESPQRPGQPRGSLRSVRGLSAPSCPGLDDKAETSARPGFLAMPREKPARRVSDSFFRPSVMEPILGRAQYNQLRKKS